MEKHFKVLDKQNLNHQDWNTVIVRTNQSKEEGKKKASKKLSDAQQKDIKLLKQVEEDNLKHKKVPQTHWNMLSLETLLRLAACYLKTPEHHNFQNIYLNLLGACYAGLDR